MSTCATSPERDTARAQRGFTLVELMVTLAIALFLLGGLLTVVQNVRQSYLNQQALAQLQDQQRFAMTVITDVIQAAGYFPNPGVNQVTNALPAAGAYAAGQAIAGTHNVAAPGDTFGVRYMTQGGDLVTVCTGATNTGAPATTHTYINAFSIGGNFAGAANQQLLCALDNAPPVALVNGVTNLQILYGVKRNFATNDFNVDTYLTATDMLAADWSNITSVVVTLTFLNPLFGQAGQPNQFITFRRVVDVMARAGVHS